MSITYKLNKDKNGVEIKFTEKPSEKVREQMKKLGFRWSSYSGVWYAKQSAETIAFAKKLAKDEGEQMTLAIVEEAETEIEEVEEEAEVVEKPAKKVSKVSKGAEKKIDPKATPKKIETKKEAKKDNIVIFPQKERPNIKVAFTDGNATFNDCLEKLNEARKKFIDSSNVYVLNGLEAMCKASPIFRNNFMRESKTYEGSFEYNLKLAKEGYSYKYGDAYFYDNDLALAFAIDYFNSADVDGNVTTKIKAE